MGIRRHAGRWLHDHDHWFSHGLVDDPALAGPAVNYITPGTATKNINGGANASYGAGYNANVTMLQVLMQFFGVAIFDVASTGMTVRFVETTSAAEATVDNTMYEATISPRFSKRRNNRRVVYA